MENRKKKVYIAGAIIGCADYKAGFAAARMELEALGYIVLNPAELPEGMEKADYMRICLAMLDTADEICMLPGWGISEGAMIEHDLSHYTKKPILYGMLEAEGGMRRYE